MASERGLLFLPPGTPSFNLARDRFGSRNTVSSIASNATAKADDIELEYFSQISTKDLSESDEEELNNSTDLLSLSSAVSIDVLLMAWFVTFRSSGSVSFSMKFWDCQQLSW